MVKKSLVEKLLNSIDKNNFPQTLLLYGPDNRQVVELINAFSFNLVKPKRDIGVEKFIELASLSLYPDFITLSKGETGSIKIEEIQALDNTICYLPFESANRIVFIKDGGSLTLQAQNALLKKIEEPPARTYFIISSSKKNSLLPTIVSRSVGIFVPQLKFESPDLTPFDFFPFLYDIQNEAGREFVAAQMKKMEVAAVDINLGSITHIERILEMISDFSDISKDEISAEKADYLKRAVSRMRLAFFSFYIKNKEPDVSLRIAQFLKNQQYFSVDASVLYNIIGENIGKTK